MNDRKKRNAKRPTRRDVAELAGVSTATVSYVLNKTQKVPTPTAERVLAAVRELNYTPDLVARSLVTQESKQLSIVLNNIRNPIYGDLILGFENQAISHGYFVNICTGNRNVDDYMENFAARRIDGIFVETLPEKYKLEEIDKLLASGIRVVLFGHTDMDLRRISCVETDYIDALETIVDYLHRLGHTDIAYLSGLEREQKYDKRIEGYLRALRSRGIGNEGALLFTTSKPSDTDVEDGRILAKKLLDSGRHATATVCTNDLMATGALARFKEAGVRVPEDMSIVGIDNAYISEITDPRLTTLSISYREVGKKAFELLYADIKNDVKGYYVNKTELIVRETTAPATTRT